MRKTDGLNRQLDWKVEVEKNNDNQVFIKDNWIRNLEEVVIEGPEVDIVEKIKKARSKDKEVVRIVEEMKKARVKELRGEEWKIEGELVLKERKIYIPKDVELRSEIIRLHHNMLVVGHRRTWRVIEDSRVGDEELLVARSNERYRKIWKGAICIRE